MAIVPNLARPWQNPDLHWHGNADEVHGATPVSGTGGEGEGGMGGASGSDMITATGGTIARSLSDWCADILYDDSGTMIPLGSAGVWHVKRGTVAAPITASSPTLRIDKYENISAATQPNPVDNAHNSAIVLIGEALATSDTQICGLWSEQRGGGDIVSADVAGVIGIGWVVHDVPRYGGNYFEGRKTFAQNGCHGVEARATNVSGVADPYVPAFGSLSMGVWATCGGSGNCAVAVAVGCIPPTKWDVGFAAVADSVVTSTFRDDSSSITSINIAGAHTIGISMAGAAISSSVAVGLPNAKYVSGMNAAGSAFIPLIGVDAGNQVTIGQASSITYSPGTVQTGTGFVSNTAADGGLDFYTAGALRFLFHCTVDGSFYVWDQPAGGIILQFGAGATRQIGFFGATPAVQQTIGAALSTGGTETNTNLATRINQLRTAMINLGLAA